MISYIKTIPKRLCLLLSITLFVIWACTTDSAEAMENEPRTRVWGLAEVMHIHDKQLPWHMAKVRKAAVLWVTLPLIWSRAYFETWEAIYRN